jgi:hypothetical protein
VLPALSMVIDDLHILGTLRAPSEADSVLVVDSYAMLPFAIVLKRLEPVARRTSQVLERISLVELVEFPARHSPDRLRTGLRGPLRGRGVEDVTSPLVSKRLDHPTM